MSDTNRLKLRGLMARYDKNAQDIADILGYSVATIHMYMSKSEERDISDDDLKCVRKELRDTG